MGEVNKIDTGAKPAPQDPKAPTPEQAAIMSQQARTGVTQASAEAPPKVDRPAWLPEKFKSPEDMAKSYLELEKKLGQPKAAPEEKKAPTEPAKAKTPDELKLPEAKAEANKVVEQAGLKMDALEAEYAEKGALSAESLKALEAAGIPKRMVDTYIAGQAALAERINGELHQIAGGPEKFDEMFEWSQTAEALTDAERNAVNKALDSKDVSQVKLAFTAVHAKWIEANGKPPEVELRGGTGGGNADVYSHPDEMKADMAKPEYKSNEAFRRSVAAKLKRSNIF